MKKNIQNKDVIPADFFGRIIPLAKLLTIWIPLLCVTLLFLITSFIKVNFGLNALYYGFHRISDAAAQLSFFGVIALIVFLMYVRDKRTLYAVLALEFVSLLVISFGLKTLVVYLMALLDELPLLSNLGLYLSDYPLSALTEGGFIYEAAIIAFVTVLGLALFLGVGVLCAKIIRDRQKKNRRDLSFKALSDNSRDNPMNTVFVAVMIVYAVYVLFNEVVETYRMLFDLSYAGYVGAPQLLSEYMYLITPYLFAMLYTVLGYYVFRLVANVAAGALSNEAQNQNQ